MGGGLQFITIVAYLLPDPAALGSISSNPEFLPEVKIVYVTEVNKWHCLGESGERLENVDLIHLVMASG